MSGIREEFEAWHNSFYGPQSQHNPIRSLERFPDSTGLGYVDPTVQAQEAAFAGAWQASRAALKVELPLEVYPHEVDHMTELPLYQAGAVVEALQQAGIEVKHG